MNEDNYPQFDFDEMVRLAQDDPEAFERKRLAMVNDVIDQSSPELQRRMSGLQWQIDQIRENRSNPMAACIRISKMMWDSVLEEDGLLEKLELLQSGAKQSTPSETQSAEIIPFNQPEKD